SGGGTPLGRLGGVRRRIGHVSRRHPTRLGQRVRFGCRESGDVARFVAPGGCIGQRVGRFKHLSGRLLASGEDGRGTRSELSPRRVVGGGSLGSLRSFSTAGRCCVDALGGG